MKKEDGWPSAPVRSGGAAEELRAAGAMVRDLKDANFLAAPAPIPLPPAVITATF